VVIADMIMLPCIRIRIKSLPYCNWFHFISSFNIMVRTVSMTDSAIWNAGECSSLVSHRSSCRRPRYVQRSSIFISSVRVGIGFMLYPFVVSPALSGRMWLGCFSLIERINQERCQTLHGCVIAVILHFIESVP